MTVTVAQAASLPTLDHRGTNHRPATWQPTYRATAVVTMYARYNEDSTCKHRKIVNPARSRQRSSRRKRSRKTIAIGVQNKFSSWKCAACQNRYAPNPKVAPATNEASVAPV